MGKGKNMDEEEGDNLCRNGVEWKKASYIVLLGRSCEARMKCVFCTRCPSYFCHHCFYACLSITFYLTAFNLISINHTLSAKLALYSLLSCRFSLSLTASRSSHP